MSEKELLAKAEAGNASALFLLCQALANGIGALSNAPHPAVEVLDELEAWIAETFENRCFTQRLLNKRIAELRKAKGV